MTKQIRYSDEFKRQAVLTYQQSELSCRQIAQSIHVHPNTLSKWIKRFKNFPLPLKSMPPKTGDIEKHLLGNLEIDAIFSALTDIENQVKILKRLITD